MTDNREAALKRIHAELLDTEGMRLRAEAAIGMSHRDGVAWFDATVPRRWHRCWPQTVGYPNFRKVERCACGAIRLDRSGPWIERNSRRKP